ncbi:hypothetical protein BpHYR1_037669 [Brachionus plicatilis]|uniref:Uncharacterized protein n=1 Tax=Brachionus plicatilis TaxID=10195 RepID=A0A3M7P5R0_BRAPC|nr:hypothetical protein BpHYR1_037669 [Brachionus plicatilis]
MSPVQGPSCVNHSCTSLEVHSSLSYMVSLVLYLVNNALEMSHNKENIMKPNKMPKMNPNAK